MLILPKNYRCNPSNLAAVGAILSTINLDALNIPGRKLGKRVDAGETMAVTRQLEHVQAQIVQTRFPELMLRKLVPLDTSVPAYAKSFTWRREQESGEAKWMGDQGADDAGNVSGFIQEESTLIREIEINHQYSVVDLMMAAAIGHPLASADALKARRAVERFIDRWGAFGDATRGIGGLLKGEEKYGVHLQVVGDGYTGNWGDTATGPTMVDDLNKFANSVELRSDGAWTAKRLVLDPASHFNARTKRYSDQYPDTVLQVFLQNHPTVTEVVSWNRCALADAGSDGPRWIAYDPNLEVCRLVCPVDYQALSPQADGMLIKVPGYARFGGVVIEEPMGIEYLDGMRD